MASLADGPIPFQRGLGGGVPIQTRPRIPRADFLRLLLVHAGHLYATPEMERVGVKGGMGRDRRRSVDDDDASESALGRPRGSSAKSWVAPWRSLIIACEGDKYRSGRGQRRIPTRHCHTTRHYTSTQPAPLQRLYQHAHISPRDTHSTQLPTIESPYIRPQMR